jgi:hypothetical protein
MIITLGSKPITTDKLRALGFAIVDLATSADRYELQTAQSRANPDSEKERDQADRACSRAIQSMRRVRRLIAAATA